MVLLPGDQYLRLLTLSMPSLAHALSDFVSHIRQHSAALASGSRSTGIERSASTGCPQVCQNILQDGDRHLHEN